MMVASKILRFIIIICSIFVIGGFATCLFVIRFILNGFRISKAKQRTVPPSILSDEKYGTHHYMHLKTRDIKIHYVEKGDRSNPLLLCVHGFPECWLSWRHQIDELSSKFWVVAIDLRGYGDSSKPRSVFQYRHENAVEDIKEFIKGLEHPDCTLVAHDFGAVFAWQLISKYPNLVKRHISINGPHSTIMHEVIFSKLEQFFKSWYIFLFHIPILAEAILSWNDIEAFDVMSQSSKAMSESATPEIREAYKYYFSQPNGFTFPLNFYRMIFFSEEIRDKIVVPTLIIWGKNDKALSTEIPSRMTHICEDVQLKWVDSAEHFVHQEKWSHVNKLISEYCEITSEAVQ